jgi:hypothetical protein
MQAKLNDDAVIRGFPFPSNGMGPKKDFPIGATVERDTDGRVIEVTCFAAKANGIFEPKCYKPIDTEGLSLVEEHVYHPEPGIMGGSSRFVWKFKRRPNHPSSLLSIKFKERICGDNTKPTSKLTLVFRDQPLY